MIFRQRVLAAQVSLALALGSVGLTPAAVQAQAMLEEVVVTARKREETLQETPVAVSAFQRREPGRAGYSRYVMTLPRWCPTSTCIPATVPRALRTSLSAESAHATRASTSTPVWASM